MDKKLTTPEKISPGAVAPRVIELARGQTLLIERTRPTTPDPGNDSGQGMEAEEDRLQLQEADGTTYLTIRVGKGGTVLELGGGPVALNVEDDLSISSRRLRLHGREEVTITSDADVKVAAQENASIRAKRQEIVSTRGDLKARANDDVIIDGERIRMNC